MNEFAWGAMSAMCMVGGLFFLRFWKKSRDPLFVYFAVAFWILAAQRLAIGLTDEKFEHTAWFYVARLAAFALILIGIWLKNRPGPD